MSPKEIMDRLMMAVMDGWMNDMLNSDLTTWDFAVETIAELNSGNAKNVVDLLAFFARDASGNLAISKEEFVQLWSKLTKGQKEAFLKDLYHDMALYGLTALFDKMGGRVKLNEVKEYLSRIISFRDLMEMLDKKYDDINFKAGVELADYVSEEELKDLVRKYVLPQLIKRK
jgi:histidinol phosphatase-like PHP family hydrolase